MKWILLVAVMAALTMVAAPEARADAVQDGINARCAGEWPDDFRMQKYCRKKQAEGVKVVAKWMRDHNITDGQQRTAWGRMFRSCSADWGNGGNADWRMLAYCLKKQTDAYKSL